MPGVPVSGVREALAHLGQVELGWALETQEKVTDRQGLMTELQNREPRKHPAGVRQR